MMYPDGRQDVGLWHRDNLAKLCTNVDGAFTMQKYPEFEYYPEEHHVYLEAEPRKNRTDIIQDIVHPPELFNYEPPVDLRSRSEEVFEDNVRQDSVAINVDGYAASVNDADTAPPGSGRNTQMPTSVGGQKSDMAAPVSGGNSRNSSAGI